MSDIAADIKRARQLDARAINLGEQIDELGRTLQNVEAESDALWVSIRAVADECGCGECDACIVMDESEYYDCDDAYYERRQMGLTAL